MRHRSERIPGKNYRPLLGKPLYAYILETLLTVPEIAQVVVDTDSPVIMEGLRKDFPQVRVIPRPEHLRDGHIPMNEVLWHDVHQVVAEVYLQTHSTNPLLRAETISRAIRTFYQVYPEYDSLFSVTRWQTRLWDAEGRPLNHDPDVLLRTWPSACCASEGGRDKRTAAKPPHTPFLFYTPCWGFDNGALLRYKMRTPPRKRAFEGPIFRGCTQRKAL